MKSLQSMRLITAIWIIFAALFLVLAVFHWHAALQDMPHLSAKPTSGIVKIDGVPIAKSGFEKFVHEFNSFIDQQNTSSRRQNTVAVIGYMVAFVTAVLSAFLTNEGCSQKLNDLRVTDVIRFLRKALDNKLTGGDVQ